MADLETVTDLSKLEPEVYVSVLDFSVDALSPLALPPWLPLTWTEDINLKDTITVPMYVYP
jgi:hypothetical protein